MNRDESLAFWYLRLNGFFLIPNFVVHTDPPSEIDILAFRPPAVFEEVGGRPEDWDPELIRDGEGNEFLLVLCEVKGGQQYDPATVFRREELRYTLPRFGMLDEDARERALDELQDQPSSRPARNLQIRKLLVAHRRVADLPPCHFVPIEHTWEFLRTRLEKYRDAKGRARTLFSADRVEELLAEIDRNRGFANTPGPDDG